MFKWLGQAHATRHFSQFTVLSMIRQIAKTSVACCMQAIVEETRDLPDTLAQSGRVAISRKQTARLIGQVGHRC